MMSRYKKLSADWTHEILYSLWLCVEFVLQSRTRFLCSKTIFGLFIRGTHLAMPKTNLRVEHLVIEAWFRGY